MAILTGLFLVLLFIIGLVSTVSRIPRKKIAAFSQSFQSLLHQDSQSIYSEEKKMALKSVFATFDKNKDGFITKQELSESLKNIGISTSEKDVVEMVQKVDVNGDGLIDFDEFSTLFESMTNREDEGGRGDEGKAGGSAGNDEDEDGDLKGAFDVFDEDKNGLISVEELSLVLDSLGFKEGKKLEDCKEMIRRVDIDGDGMINFFEFKSMMKNGTSLVSVP